MRTEHATAWSHYLLLALLVLVTPFSRAESATINFVTPALNANNTGDYSQTSPRREFRSELALQYTNATSFCVRYASVLAVDVASFGNTETESVASSYRISFTVTESSPGEPWTVKLRSDRRGAYTIINDGGRHGTARITSSITATSSTGNSLASLAFGGGSATNSGTPGEHKIVPIDQHGEAIITGTGTTNVTLNFTWTSSVTSDPDGSPFGGDEAAVRLGLSTIGINRIKAGDYEQLNDRSKAADGHFVCAELCPPPSVVVSQAQYCSPLSGSPCTFTACGHVVGCVENNYSVVLTYVDKDGLFVVNAIVSVTNGDPNWCSSVQLPGGGPCTGYPYDIVASIIDTPGLKEQDITADMIVAAQAENATRYPVVLAEGCAPIPSLPSTTTWGRTAAVLLVVTAGIVGIVRRRQS